MIYIGRIRIEKCEVNTLGSVIETSIGNAIDIGVKNNLLEIVEGEKIVKK